MGSLAGVVGLESEAAVRTMLGAVTYRGRDEVIRPLVGATLGLRLSSGSESVESQVFVDEAGGLVLCAGSVVGTTSGAASVLADRLRRGDFLGLDGAFAACHYDVGRRTLTLLRDPFGQRAVFYALRGEVLYFASELKQLLALAELPVALDPLAIHAYLTFSFVPGEATPISGVSRLPPGHRLTFKGGRIEVEPYFALEERLIELAPADAAQHLRRLSKAAVGRRLGAKSAALALSGGLDSSAVGLWLKTAGVPVTAFTLDFGAASVEREEARETAAFLGFPQVWVPADPAAILEHLDTLVWHLDMPFGDGVTGPQWLLAKAVREAGFETLWNGEGGDQLFGGWTSKPMVAAAVFGTADELSLEEQYLRSYHRFYGLEGRLYGRDLAASVSPGLRRGFIARFLGDERQTAFLNRVRLTDISLKGSQNILPRAGRMAAAHGLSVQMPLFDRALAEWSFTLPPALKLHGSCEKYVMKLALQNRLPKEIVWRRKFGMSVPLTDWMFGALRPAMEERLSETAVSSRGLFQPEYVRELRLGKDVASETRRRRLGERLWALLVLETWCRLFVDGRGRPVAVPGAGAGGAP